MRARGLQSAFAVGALLLIGFGWLQAGAGDSRPEHPDVLAEFRRQIRGNPEAGTITEMKLAAIKYNETLPQMGVEKDAGIWNWDWLGPGNIGGRVRAILIHPDNGDIIWIGSASGGIWKTYDGGATWAPLNDFLPSLSVTALVAHPGNPDVLFASTGEGFSQEPPGAGIFRSYDGGATWNQLPATVDPVNLRWINDLIIDPNNGHILLAAGVTDTHTGRLIRSYDGGDHWQEVLTQPSAFTDLAIDPDDSHIVLASTRDSVLRSDQNGISGSWTELSTGVTGKLPDVTGRTAFSFGEGNDMVYASLDRERELEEMPRGDVWRSNDNGVTWEYRGTPEHLMQQGWYDNVIWLEPGSTDRLMIGGIDLAMSQDGGLTWTVISNWRLYHDGGSSAHADQHVIVPHPDYGSGNSTIFVGNDGGIQKNTWGFSTPNWAVWTNLCNNLGITQFYHADAAPDGSVILGGTQDNDDLRFKRSAGAQAWFQAETGDGTYTAIDPQTPLFMYTSYLFLKMEFSMDGGETYFWRTNGLWDAEQEGRVLPVAPFALDKVWPTNLVAGGRSIWRTNNRGDYWYEVLTPRTDNPLCSAVEISPTEGSVVTWVGYTNGAIWKTEDTAATWQEVVHPLPAVKQWITDIEISPHDPHTVMVTYGGYSTERVWITRDNGVSWESLDGEPGASLPVIQVNCATFHPGTPDWIYVGTDVGIYASEDQGSHWSVTPRWDENEGPVNVEVSDLIWYANDTMVAVTYGRGLYECRPLDIVYVNQHHGGTELGTFAYPFDTFGEGWDAAGHGARLRLYEGDYDEAARALDKRVTIEAEMGQTAVIR